MNKIRIPIYDEKLNFYETALSLLKKKHGYVSLTRLLLFLAICLSWFYLFPSVNAILGATLGSLFIIVFAYFLKVHKNLEDKRNYLEQIITVNKNEISCCTGNFSVFNAGGQQIHHPH